MASMHASSAVDRWLEPGWVKPKTKIGICCFSAKYAVLRSKRENWIGMRIILSSEVTCLPADCCFSEKN